MEWHLGRVRGSGRGSGNPDVTVAAEREGSPAA